MPVNICPSLFFIVPDTISRTTGEDDIFKPDRFRILQAGDLTRIREIVSNTGSGQPLQIRLLCCYRMKGIPETYCEYRRVVNVEKRICNEKSGIQTGFIHFNIRLKERYNAEYLLAFIEGADLRENIDALINELFHVIIWLEIQSRKVYLNIFTFGEPAFKTNNTNYLDECIYSAKQRTVYENIGDIGYDITHINQNFKNCLTVSLKNGALAFNPS